MVTSIKSWGRIGGGGGAGAEEAITGIGEGAATQGSAWSPAIPFDGGGGAGAEEGVGRIGERAEESSSQGLARSPAMSLDDGLFEKHDGDGGSMGLEAGGGAAPLVRWRWRRRRPSLGHDVTGEGREGGVVDCRWLDGLFWAIHLRRLIFLGVHECHITFFWWMAYVGLMGSSATYILTVYISGGKSERC